MSLDPADLQTETFTNSQGWTVIRVTHAPSGTVAERERSATLSSSVQAQADCIAELERRLASAPRRAEPPPREEPVTRAELDALAARVAELERRIQ